MKEYLKVVVIDDEEKARRGLKNLLQEYCPEVIVSGEADNIDEAYDLISIVKPDLVFLDIQMPNGNGFRLLERFDKPDFDVVFVTGYDHYALNAIKFSALDYLLKPLEVADLVAAVKKALAKKKSQADTEARIDSLLSLANQSPVEKRIVVHQNEKVILLKLKDIVYIEADDRYCHITTVNAEKYTITKTLKEFEELLAPNDNFLRISKNYILNINFVRDYTKGEPCVVKMENGNTMELSRRKKQEFLTRLKR